MPLKDPIAAIFNVTGRRVHKSTAMRWMLDGCGGVRLRSWLLGGRRLTNEQAVEEFLVARSGRSAQVQTISESEAYLDQNGMG